LAFLTLLELLPLPHSIPDFLFCDDWFCPLSIRQQYPARGEVPCGKQAMERGYSKSIELTPTEPYCS
ncbi:hypothetical protein, partial [Trichormus variabilis]|uniref:hypothetical protein n=1 Tax=Anabaena variabilis TaxID=264691 RepID=UPI001A7E3595